MPTTTTCLRSRLLILPPSPAPPHCRLPPAASARPYATDSLLEADSPPRGSGAAAGGTRGAGTKEDNAKGAAMGSRFAEAERLAQFLRADLPYLFDKVGIGRTAYDDRVRSRNPITRHDTIDSYLFRIRLLMLLFRPDIYLHSVKQTGPYELTTRWTTAMKFMLLPWKPELVFTGCRSWASICRISSSIAMWTFGAQYKIMSTFHFKDYRMFPSSCGSTRP